MQDGPAATSSRRCSTARMPNLGRYSQPDGPVPNWSELCRWAASTRRAPPRKRPWSRPCDDMVLRRRGACARPAPTASTSTPPAPPATPTSSRRSRAVEEIKRRVPRPRHRDRHGERVRARHARRARVRRRAPRRPVAARPDEAGGQGRRRPCSGPAVNVNTDEVGRLERRPRLHHRQAVHARTPRSPST